MRETQGAGPPALKGAGPSSAAWSTKSRRASPAGAPTPPPRPRASHPEETPPRHTHAHDSQRRRASAVTLWPVGRALPAPGPDLGGRRPQTRQASGGPNPPVPEEGRGPAGGDGPEDGPGGSGPRAAPWSSSPGEEDRGLSLRSDPGRGRQRSGAVEAAASRACSRPAGVQCLGFILINLVMYGAVASLLGTAGAAPCSSWVPSLPSNLGSTDPRFTVRRQLRGEEGPKRDRQGLWASRPHGSPGPVARQRLIVW